MGVIWVGSHTGDAGRDDNDVGVLKCLLGAIVGREVACSGLARVFLISSLDALAVMLSESYVQRE